MISSEIRLIAELWCNLYACTVHTIVEYAFDNLLHGIYKNVYQIFRKFFSSQLQIFYCDKSFTATNHFKTERSVETKVLIKLYMIVIIYSSRHMLVTGN